MMFDPTLGWIYKDARSHLVLGVTPAYHKSDKDLRGITLDFNQNINYNSQIQCYICVFADQRHHVYGFI